MKFKQKMSEFLRQYDLEKLTIKLPFIDADFNLTDDDLTASWEIYVELATRITTQPLEDDAGVEQAALDSIYNFFVDTRKVIREKGRKAPSFSHLAISMLNNCIRQFTAKWHKISANNGFSDPATCTEFRNDLKKLQEKLGKYAALFAKLAFVDNDTVITDDPIAD